MQIESPDTLDGMARAEVLRASPPMFEAKWLDRLSRVHHYVPLAIFIPTIGVLLALGADGGVGGLEVFGWLAAGWLTWTLTEYWMHRLIFHFEPEHGLGARLHWIIHGVHHDHPNDPLRLVMPPSVSVPLASLFFGAFVLAVGTPAAYPFTAGFLGGYLVYDMLHFYLHHHVPATRTGRWLRELHMRHHFQDETRGFGISAPFWDVVFRTPVRKRSAA
jgi:sterol desaturase/sphingolipid hydroxylase (fatty acid hydroxylase superfamily)